MSEAPGPVDLWIVGAGRAGLALGLLLHRTGAVRSLHYSGRAPRPPAHPLFAPPAPPAAYRDDLRPPADSIAGILLAVPDATLSETAARLAAERPREGSPVLHLSGALDLDVLEPLRRAGHPVGGLHPLAAIASPLDADRLRGVAWGVEGEGAARVLAGRLVAATGGRVLPLAPGGKPLYHAAAVFASNYVVALLGVAEQLMARAGVAPREAREALAALATGAVHNTREAGAVAALTGPVSRGDADTLRLHLACLSPAERALYSPLARAALLLARAGGLRDEAAQRIEALLEEER